MVRPLPLIGKKLSGAVLFGAVLALCAVAPASAATVGQDFIPVNTCQNPGTYVQSGVESGNSYKVPFDGILTSWSFHAGTSPATGLQLKVLRPVDPNYVFGYTSWVVVGESPGGPTRALETSTWSAHLPVHQGDIIGIYATGGYCSLTIGNEGKTYYQWWEEDVPVGTQKGASFPFTDQLIPVSAVVEPDADHDGFGDDTQDGCPTDTGTSGPCPDRIPPETTILKGPRRKTTKKRAEFKFISNEANSSFGCQLDGKFGFAPCDPTEAFRVGRGKHTLAVRAVDAAGNPDPTPATYRWRVVKKKPNHKHRSAHH